MPRSVLIILVVLLILILLGVVNVRGHTYTAQGDPYPPGCCSNDDCVPIPFNAVKATSEGWRLGDGTIVPFDSAMRSFDRRFHICITAQGKVRVLDSGKICLLAPEAHG